MLTITQLFRMLFKWARDIQHYRSLITLAIISGLISGLASTSLLAVINLVLTGHTTRARTAFFALCILIPVSGFFSQWLLVRLTAQASYDVRMKLARQVLAAPYAMAEEKGIPRIMAAFAEDVQAVALAITSLPLLVTQIAIILGCLVYLSWLYWPLLLCLLASMLIGILSYRTAAKRSNYYFRLMREGYDLMFVAIRGLTEGLKELKLNRWRRNDFLDQDLEPAVMTIRKQAIRGNTIGQAATNAGQILFFVFIGLVLFVVPRFTATSHEVLFGYTVTVLFMIAPLTLLLNQMPILSRAYVSAKKINSLGADLGSQAPEPDTTIAAPPTSWKRLELIDLIHRYRHDGPVDEFHLGPLNLSFVPGELVFLIGGNGSGKTTLAKLLMGLYEPEKGEIRLDGRLLTIDWRDEYRQYFSVVFYDFFLFEKLLGVSNDDFSTRSSEYLEQLQLSHKVQIENGKFSTLNLSQGQRKRLALLTSYLEDRSIYIFDEWAADQDPMFKEIFYYRILPDLKALGKTVIVITHDDRYFDLADRIIKLDRGQLEYDRRRVHSIASPPDIVPDQVIAARGE
jgi:putative pyoverdin transport system ATP-binding/permease protein